MALTRVAIELLAPVLRRKRILCFGYPDLLISPEEARYIFCLGNVPVAASPHPVKVKGMQGPFADTAALFEKLGVALTCVDIAPSRGVEQVVDLNEPLDVGRFDLVIDAGTIEHCANIGQALLNAASAVEPGGYVFHSPPLSMVNHGFYNVCPTLLWDFYSQNGWRVIHLSGFLAGVHAPMFPGFEIPQQQRTGRCVLPNEAALYFLAQRNSEAPPRWPKQTKYLEGSK